MLIPRKQVAAIGSLGSKSARTITGIRTENLGKKKVNLSVGKSRPQGQEDHMVPEEELERFLQGNPPVEAKIVRKTSATYPGGSGGGSGGSGGGSGGSGGNDKDLCDYEPEVTEICHNKDQILSAWKNLCNNLRLGCLNRLKGCDDSLDRLISKLENLHNLKGGQKIFIDCDTTKLQPYGRLASSASGNDTGAPDFIFLDIGNIIKLSYGTLEAILLHELVHICSNQAAREIDSMIIQYMCYSPTKDTEIVWDQNFSKYVTEANKDGYSDKTALNGYYFRVDLSTGKVYCLRRNSFGDIVGIRGEITNPYNPGTPFFPELRDLSYRIP